MVLASERFIRDNNLDAVWITGVGHSAETYWMGDRMGNNPTAEHADAYALGRSFEQVLRMAGITDPAKQVHVAELYAPFSNTEYHSIDAARLVASPGEFDRAGCAMASSRSAAAFRSIHRAARCAPTRSPSPPWRASPKSRCRSGAARAIIR